MPQYKPTYICIPRDIKADPERFGLHQNYWPAANYPSLDVVESCNQIALLKEGNVEATLTDEQYERYTKAVAIIIGWQRAFGLEGDTHLLTEGEVLQVKNDRRAIKAWLK